MHTQLGMLGLVLVLASVLQGQIIPMDDTYSVAPGSMLQADGSGGNPNGVLANDSGAAGDGSENATVISEPGNGSVVLSGDGTFTYTPAANFQGTDRFSYEIDRAPGSIVLDSSSVWRALFNPESKPPDLDDPDFDQTWITPGFDDAGWTPATGLIGYGVLDDTEPDTVLERPPSGLRYTGYLRSSFTVPSAGRYRIDVVATRDDAAIIYVGGQELGKLTRLAAFAVSTWPNDYFLSVEGIPAAFADFVDEITPYPLSGRLELEAGPQTVAVSMHNNLNPTALTSSDLGFRMDSLKVTPVASATVTVTVAGNAPSPEVTNDWFSIASDADYDSGSEGRSLYDNDGLLDETGTPFFAIQSLTIDDMTSAGTVSASDSATGEFTFSPTPGFVGQTRFSYQVTTAGGTSSAGEVILEVSAAATLNPLPLVIVAPGFETFSFAAPPGTFTKILTQPETGGAEVGASEESVDSAVLFYQTSAAPRTGIQKFTVATQSESTALIEPTSSWRFLHPLDGTDPATGDPDFNTTWFTATYDDSEWTTGSGQFGYGNSSVETSIGTPPSGLRLTAYFRHKFTSSVAGSALANLALNLSVDDGAIIYLNGVEVTRFPDFFLGDDIYELRAPSSLLEYGTAIRIVLPTDLLDTGENILAISVHNSSSSSSDLGMRCDGLFGAGGTRSIFPVQVNVVSPMRVWLESYFDASGIDDPEVAGSSADPDLDFVSNLIEYIHDTDPTDPASVPDISVGVATSGVGSALSAAPIFAALPNGIPFDTLIEAQVSNDLDQWWTAGAQYGTLSDQWLTPSGVSNNPIGSLVFPIDPAGAPQFYRVRYSLAPWVTDIADRLE